MASSVCFWGHDPALTYMWHLRGCRTPEHCSASKTTDTGKETAWRPCIRWPTFGVFEGRLVAVSKWIMTVLGNFNWMKAETVSKYKINACVMMMLVSVNLHERLCNTQSLVQLRWIPFPDRQVEELLVGMCVCICVCVWATRRPPCETLFSLASPRTAASNLWPPSIRCIQSPSNRRAAAQAAVHRWGENHGKHS